MYFILAMQTRKWICFYAVRKVTDNVPSLGEVAYFGKIKFQLKNKYNAKRKYD